MSQFGAATQPQPNGQPKKGQADSWADPAADDFWFPPDQQATVPQTVGLLPTASIGTSTYPSTLTAQHHDPFASVQEQYLASSAAMIDRMELEDAPLQHILQLDTKALPPSQPLQASIGSLLGDLVKDRSGRRHTVTRKGNPIVTYAMGTNVPGAGNLGIGSTGNAATPQGGQGYQPVPIPIGTASQNDNGAAGVPGAGILLQDEESRQAAAVGGFSGSSNVHRRWVQEKRQRARWSPDEEVLFFDALRRFGTSFNLIAVLFPDKTRTDVAQKFHLENRKNPARLNEALANPIPIDPAEYEELLKSVDSANRKENAAVTEAEAMRLLEGEAPGNGQPGDVGNSNRPPNPNDTSATNQRKRQRGGQQPSAVQPFADGVNELLNDEFDLGDSHQDRKPAQGGPSPSISSDFLLDDVVSPTDANENRGTKPPTARPTKKQRTEVASVGLGQQPSEEGTANASAKGKGKRSTKSAQPKPESHSEQHTGTVAAPAVAISQSDLEFLADDSTLLPFTSEGSGSLAVGPAGSGQPEFSIAPEPLVEDFLLDELQQGNADGEDELGQDMDW